MEVKICTKCKRELPVENFRWKNKADNRRHSQCKDCQKAQEHQHYLESKARQDNVKMSAFAQKSSNLLLVSKYRQQGCSKCGEKREYVLDFHHIDPSTKKDTINHMLKSASYDTLQKEIEKCVVLCSNCHREFHYFESLYGITLKDFLPI